MNTTNYQQNSSKEWEAAYLLRTSYIQHQHTYIIYKTIARTVKLPTLQLNWLMPDNAPTQTISLALTNFNLFCFENYVLSWFFMQHSTFNLVVISLKPNNIHHSVNLLLIFDSLRVWYNTVSIQSIAIWTNNRYHIQGERFYHDRLQILWGDQEWKHWKFFCFERNQLNKTECENTKPLSSYSYVFLESMVSECPNNFNFHAWQPLIIKSKINSMLFHEFQP